MCKLFLMHWLGTISKGFYDISPRVTMKRSISLTNSETSHLNKIYLEPSFSAYDKYIDESVAPYFGAHGSHQKINNKPICVGYKILVLENSMDMLQFDPYQGAQTGKQIASKTRWGLDEMVLLCLMGSLLSKVNYDVFMDNYFTSFRLLMHLGAHDIRATVVLNKKNLSNCIIIDDKAL